MEVEVGAVTEVDWDCPGTSLSVCDWRERRGMRMNVE